MRARFLPSLPGMGHSLCEVSDVWLSFPSSLMSITLQLQYSQVHFLPGKWIGQVFHLVVTMLWNSGLQGRAQLLQNLVELLCNAAFWFDLVHLWEAKPQVWKEATSTFTTIAGSRSLWRDHSGEKEETSRVLPLPHCFHKDLGSDTHTHTHDYLYQWRWPV